jgi:hypothetical protein
MQTINIQPPLSMTPDQRRLEVATLLARGLARLHLPTTNTLGEESGLPLAISPGGSVHDGITHSRQVSQ